MKGPAIAIALIAGVAACTPLQAGPGAAGPASSSDDLDSRARTCARDAAYRPVDSAERRLAAGEMAYRQCLYVAINDAAASSARDAERQALFRRLIATDQSLTAEVAAGTMSQAERAAALDRSKAVGDQVYQDVIDLLTGRRQQLARAQQLRDLRYLFQLQQEVTRNNLTVIPSGQ